MNAKRLAVCEGCQGYYHGCRQICGPISEDELEYMGASWSDRPTVESVRKLLECSMKPECMKVMLDKYPIEAWTFALLNRCQPKLYPMLQSMKEKERKNNEQV